MESREISPVRAVVTIAVALLLIVALGVGGCSSAKSWGRYQKRADANNAVKVTSINIRKAAQQARVVRAQNAAVTAKAQQRFLEAVGIRRAQDEISSTLTPYYLQHEAIQAQEKMAASGRNNTSIYIPAGANGVPLVNDVSKAQAAQGAKP